MTTTVFLFFVCYSFISRQYSKDSYVCEFTLTEFSKRKHSSNQFYSPPFYAHQYGYKLCFWVHANGYRRGKNTHISLYVTMMAGDNDDQLHWPFTGDIVLELVNWREDKRHYSITMSICDLIKVTEGTVGDYDGYPYFIFHSSLSYNLATNTEYLHNDSLRLRVKQVAVYSTPLLVKTPSWQRPCKVSDSVCEFTLDQFTKRKNISSQFYSSPFYTDKGYKMCLFVHANGCDSGNGTHVSAYVQLMAGDNDDQLQWPLVGDIDIILLNWREDKRHYYNRTISIDTASGFIRVLEGRYGHTMGYHRFISHSFLPYDRSDNTEYLQDDSLRFRVNMVTK